MKRKTLLLLIPFMLLSSCSKGNNKSEESSIIEEPTKVNVSLEAMLLETDKTKYDIEFEYRDSFFNEDSSIFNSGLAMISFGFSLGLCLNKLTADNILTECGFHDIEDYDTLSSNNPDGIGYVFAMKEIDNRTLINVNIRGSGYELEWSDNFNVGKEGNHNGFQNAADTVLSSLKRYITSKNVSNYKLWIQGYSRGGAVSNLIANNIFNDESLDILEKDIYVYTFEAPRGILLDQISEHKGVHNIVNSADIVASILPDEYGLGRIGEDIDIFDNNYVELVKAYDPSISYSSYAGSSSDTIKDFKNRVLNGLLRVPEEGTEEANYSIHNRDSYVDNMQATFMYLFKLFFSLKKSTLNRIVERLKSMTNEEYQSLLAKDRAFSILNPYIKEDGVEYNGNEFKYHLNKVVTFIPYRCTDLVYQLISPTTRPNLITLISMHLPIVNYVLLKNYLSTLK